MKQPKDIFRLLAERERTCRHIELQQDNPVSDLIEKGAVRPLFNLLFLLLCLCCSVVLTINLAIFLVRDVVLFQHEMTVNRSGAIIPTKSCDTEQALFLFNTSDLWADTDIQVYRGDRIKISASGAFYSSIQDLDEAARANRKPKYGTWIGSNLRKQQETSAVKKDSACNSAKILQSSPFAVKKDSYIGSILYQIREDAEPCASDWCNDKDRIKEICVLTHEFGERFHPVEKTGNLYFAINDIYLNDSLIESYAAANRDAMRLPHVLEKFGLQKTLHGSDTLYTGPRDSINRLIEEKKMELYLLESSDKNGTSTGRLYCFGPKFRDHFEANRDIWYRDNLGQIALTIEIQRYIPQTPKQIIAGNKWWYRTLEQSIFQALDKGQRSKILLIGSLFLVGSLLAFALLTASLAVVFYTVFYSVYILVRWSRSGFRRPPLPPLKHLAGRLREKFKK